MSNWNFIFDNTPRQTMSPAMRAEIDENDERLTTLWNYGVPSHIMALVLDRRPEYVRDRAKKLNLTPRIGGFNSPQTQWDGSLPPGFTLPEEREIIPTPWKDTLRMGRQVAVVK